MIRDVVILLSACLSSAVFCHHHHPHVSRGEPSSYSLNLMMPGAEPTKNDQYLCTSIRVDQEELYITQFNPHGDAGKAHHMLIYGCEEMGKNALENDVWDCVSERLCIGMKIIFAWAKNAPPTRLPPEVGYLVGKGTKIKHLLLQVHYVHPLPGEKDNSGFTLSVTNQKQKYLSGMYLLLRSSLIIPPRTPVTHGDINCQANTAATIHPFAFRVHAHTLGTVISGYKFEPDTLNFKLLGKSNPQWPQAFYPMENVEEVRPTDFLLARCTFNSSLRNRYTTIGSTTNDEMCNLYIMYFTDSKTNDVYHECFDEQRSDLSKYLPDDSDKPMPSNPALEEHAMLHHHGSAGEEALNYNSLFTETKPTMDKKGHSKKKPSVSFSGYTDYGYKNQQKWSSIDDAGYPYNFASMPQNHNHNPMNSAQALSSTGFTAPSHFRQFATQEKQETLEDSGLSVDPKWPSQSEKLGQVSAVSLDKNGNVVIFHRGSHVWNAQSFSLDNVYRQRESGPIEENTVIVYNSSTGSVVQEWGKGMFHLPHGLTVDKDNNLWLTDVAMHQVFKYSALENGKNTNALLTLGTAFEPGNDDTHFCKPTAVAVMAEGDFFVSDGYCNARIIKYNSQGKKLLQWGHATNNIQVHPAPYTFTIPHALTMAEDKGLVCVADRENGRVQCFTSYNGTFHCEISLGYYGSRLFSMEYSPVNGGRLYAVNGPEFSAMKKKVQGFIIDLDGRKLLSTFSPNDQGFGNPHDITVSKDGSEVYVVELEPYKVWKLTAVDKSGTKNNDGNEAISEQQKGKKIDVDLKKNGSNLAQSPEVKSVAPGVGVDPLSMTILILSVVSIPMLLIILIAVILQMKKRGHLQRCSLSNVRGWCSGYSTPHADKFGLGDFLNHRKGFEKLNTEEEESDREDGGSSGSDVEEFKAHIPKA